jgi:arabinogalactan oligomer/maltooligosaccharide transport system substrate-binding protein
MMKKSALWHLLALSLLGALLLSACAPAATPTEEPTEIVEPTEKPTEVPPTEVPEPTEPPTEPPVEELVIWADALFAPILEEISRDFTEEYGVEVVVQPMSMDDVREQTLIAAPAGEGPDIIEGPHDWVGALVEGGVLAPIDLAEKQDLFLPAAIQAFTYEGKLYGMGLITENVALFRNIDLMPEAPETWDEMVEMCDEIMAEGVEHCFLLQQGDAYHFFPILSSFGGYLFGQNPDRTYNPDDIGIDSPGSLASAEWLDSMVKMGYIQADVDYDTAKALFSEGQAGMYLTGPWNLSFFQESETPYAISPIPAGTEEAKPFLGVRGLMVSAFSEQPLLAQTFLTEFWTTEGAMQAYYEATNKPVALMSVCEKIDDPDIAALGEAGRYAMAMPAIPEMAAFWGTMGDAITLIMQQQADPIEAFQNAAEQIRALIAEGS